MFPAWILIPGNAMRQDSNSVALWMTKSKFNLNQPTDSWLSLLFETARGLKHRIVPPSFSD